MTVRTAAGSKLFIGSEDPTEATNTQGEFEADTYTQVGEVEDMGEFGDQWNETTFESLADSRTRHLKTTRDAGTAQMVIGFDSSDAGQAAVEAALESVNDYTFKITANDEGSGSPSNPTTIYFRAKVMSYRFQFGTNGNVIRVTMNLAINSALVRVDAV